MTRQQLGVTLEVKVWDKNGKLLAERRKKGDLLLRNFMRFAVHIHTFGRDSWIDGFVDEAGVIFDAGDVTNLIGRKIAIGTGTTAPTYTDYALQAKVAEVTTVTLTEVADNEAAAAASITLVTGATITEAGYFIKPDVAGVTWMMVIRDTFAGVTVPDGGTISITFRVTV